METTGGTPGVDVPSLAATQTFFDGSNILQVKGTPAHALFHTDKYLVGDVTINIRSDLQSEPFRLMSDEFMMRCVKISDFVRLQHIAIIAGTCRKGLRPRPALYLLDGKAYNIPQGPHQGPTPVELLKERFVSRQGTETHGRRFGPKRCIRGKKARNPFNFQLFNLKLLKRLVNGEGYPTPRIELEDNGHANGYNSLFLGIGTMHRSAYPTHLHPDYREQVTMKGVFTQGTDIVVTVIVNDEFVDIMEIDANKNVTHDLA